MSYLPGFNCDVFISYVHANNDDGWVTHFHNELQREIDDFMEDVTIWRDKRLGSNTEFDPEIARQVKGSAVFIAIVSRRFLSSEYCKKELRMFHQKAHADRWGLSIENQKRIFNLLLHDIHHDQWPDELKGVTGLKFHDDLGFPCDQQEKDFKLNLRKLTLEIVGLLESFKKAIAAAEPRTSSSPASTTPASVKQSGRPDDDAFTVFLATASSSLEAQQERILNDLTRNGIRVITEVPPPYEAEEHDRRVRAELNRARLSVHLLTGAPGEPIRNPNDAPGQMIKKSYSQRQAELGLEYARTYAKHQLIWLPPELDIESIEIERHKQYLAELEIGERPPTSRIIRPPKSEIVRVILDTVEGIEQNAKAPVQSLAALLNFNAQNRREARKLGDLLDQIGVLPIDQPEMGEPEETMKILGVRIKQVNRLLFVYGSDGRHWVRDRVSLLLGMASMSECMPKVCGVCFVPPCSKATDGNFRLPYKVPIREFDLQEIADPEALKPLMEVA